MQVALLPEPVSDASDEVHRLLGRSIAVAEEYAWMEGMIEGQLTELRDLLLACKNRGGLEPRRTS